RLCQVPLPAFGNSTARDQTEPSENSQERTTTSQSPPAHQASRIAGFSAQIQSVAIQCCVFQRHNTSRKYSVMEPGPLAVHNLIYIPYVVRQDVIVPGQLFPGCAGLEVEVAEPRKVPNVVHTMVRVSNRLRLL